MLKLKDQVEITLKDYPASRDSDTTLTITLWKKFYSAHMKTTSTGDTGIYLKSLYTLPSQDNIKRIRAILNAEGRFLPTDSRVRRKRRINEEVWRAYVNSQTEYKRI